jgi:hypothetical protein
MSKAAILPALLVTVATVCFASNAEAWRWRYFNHNGHGDSYSIRSNNEDRRRGREAEWPESAPRRSGAFGAIVDRLIRGCGQQGVEMQNWPFDFIAQIVSLDDKQRSALDELRGTVKQAADSLMSNCPQDVPAAPTARFDAIEQAIDAAIEGFNIVQPTLQTFYAALDDEQKARLLRDMIAGGTQDKTDRRNRWRSYASANRKGDVNQWASICEHLTAVLRGWPVREVERNVRLSETQRVAFYELVTASLKAADSLVNSCPSDTALTPVRRMDAMRKRLAAVREAAVAIRPTLVRFHEVLDNGQKIRFAAMN